MLFLPLLLYRGKGWTASPVENVTTEFSPRLKLPPIMWVDQPIGTLYSIQLDICKHSLGSSFNSKFPISTKQSDINITLILPTFYYQEHYFYPFVSNKQFYQRGILFFFFFLLDEYMKLEKCVQLEEDEIRRRRDIRLAREKELQNKGKWNQSSSNLYLWYQLNIRILLNKPIGKDKLSVSAVRLRIIDMTTCMSMWRTQLCNIDWSAQTSYKCQLPTVYFFTCHKVQIHEDQLLIPRMIVVWSVHC